MKDTDELERILNYLAEKLEYKGKGPYIFFVCGGAALLYRRLIERVTIDVDILGFGDKNGDDLEIRIAQPFPVTLRNIAIEVSEDLGVERDWLNPGPTSLLKFGLPEGFVSRCIEVVYGTRLTVFYASRYDQIHFKLYAAVDQGPGKHVDDLLELSPSEEEILAAARWAITHDPSDGFLKILKEMLKELNYETAAEKI